MAVLIVTDPSVPVTVVEVGPVGPVYGALGFPYWATRLAILEGVSVLGEEAPEAPALLIIIVAPLDPAADPDDPAADPDDPEADPPVTVAPLAPKLMLTDDPD